MIKALSVSYFITKKSRTVESYYFTETGLHLEKVYLDELPRLEYIKPNTFTPLRELRTVSLSDNINLKSIDVQAFDKQQKIREVSEKNIRLKNV